MNDDNITYFAETDSRNKKVKFGIKDSDRLRHIYSIGKTGMGKSTMLENMAIQDIQNGNGMAFLDPHGKTADLLLEYIPEHRIKDVIYFAPFDTSHPVSFNVMEDVGPDRRHLVVSGLMSAFEKIWADAWSARMAYILQNTLAALLEYPGATLLGVNRMYSDKEYRNKVVAHVKDPTIRSFWTEEYAKYTDRYTQEATPAIQNKIGQFTSNPLVRNIIGQSKSSFDLRKVMDDKKILIVNLSKGLVGENNANLLGSMLVTKIYLAAMSRADSSEKELKKLPNFYLYVDEFQSFANKSFADILSEARKYKLSLNITHQYIEQMAEEVRAAVFGNVGTMISFRVGSYDAEVLEKEFAPVFTAQDIVNLGFVQIYLKLMIDGVASQPFSATTLAPIPKPEITLKEQVVQSSRETYAQEKTIVENNIKDWMQPEQSAQSASDMNSHRSYERPDKPRAERSKDRIVDRKPKEELSKELTKEKVEEPVSKETKEEKQKLGNNVLAAALASALKEKKPSSEPMPVVAVPAQPKVEKADINTISLKELTPNKKTKEATPANMNALKEALERAKAEKAHNSFNTNPKKEEEPVKPENMESQKATIKEEKQNKVKEIPEETLRKILKGD